MCLKNDIAMYSTLTTSRAVNQHIIGCVMRTLTMPIHVLRYRVSVIDRVHQPYKGTRCGTTVKSAN